MHPIDSGQQVPHTPDAGHPAKCRACLECRELDGSLQALHSPHPDVPAPGLQQTRTSRPYPARARSILRWTIRTWIGSGETAWTAQFAKQHSPSLSVLPYWHAEPGPRNRRGTAPNLVPTRSCRRSPTGRLAGSRPFSRDTTAAALRTTTTSAAPAVRLIANSYSARVARFGWSRARLACRRISSSRRNPRGRRRAGRCCRRGVARRAGKPLHKMIGD